MVPTAEEQAEIRPQRRLKKRHLTFTLTVLIVLGIIAPPFITLNRHKARFSESISAGLGRRVTIGNITLRLLPRPGFDLTDFTVFDDPAYSAEPMLHAESVTAAIRIRSLWRGQLEIARLSLTDPSINLVRTQDGRWNIESLLDRAQKTPSAPTANRAESRLRFPYIEADDARINFKFGQQKSLYALSEADISFWQDSEEEWQMRLEARPLRTDVSLNDVGTVKINGAFRRVGAGPTPFHIDASLVDAQLGQVTHLVSGRDAGWRGSLNIAATAVGTIRQLDWTTDVRLNDFRRYDIRLADPIEFQAHCSAKYQDAAAMSQELSALDCRTRTSNAETRLTGSVHQLFQHPQPDLNLLITRWPVNSLVTIARRAKRSLSPDLTATGEVDGHVHITGTDSTQWNGTADLHDVSLSAQTLQPGLKLGDIQLTIGETAPAARKTHAVKTGESSKNPGALQITMFPVPLGPKPDAPAKTFVSGSIGPQAMDIELRGQADVQRALAVAETLGFHPPDVNMVGTLDGNVTIHHEWSQGFTGPEVNGKVSITGLRLERSGALFPVTADFATVELTPKGNTLWAQDARLGDTNLHLRGSVTFPQGCTPKGGQSECPLRFDAAFGDLHLEDLARAFTATTSRSWFSFGRKEKDPNAWMSTAAEGTVTVAHLSVRNLSFEQMKARVTLDSGIVALNEITAQAFGGRLNGTWSGDFTAKTPSYHGSGRLEHASIDRLGSAFWTTAWSDPPVRGGSLDAGYELDLNGTDASQLAQSAKGTFDVEWTGGILNPTVKPPKPLRIAMGTARITLQDSVLHVEGAKLVTPNDVLTVQGSISFARVIQLNLQSKNGERMAVLKTLRQPEAEKTAGLRRP